MKLPNCEQAIVTESKVRDYLLDRDHPQNKGKAGFYEGIGFTKLVHAQLRATLITLACTGEVEGVVPAKEGLKYVMVGFIQAPNQKRYPLKSIRMIEFGSILPRLVSAYPIH